MLGSVWGVLFLALVVMGLAGEYPVLAAVGGMGLLVAGGAWVWSRLSLERLDFERTLSANRAFAGDEVLLRITVTNRKPIPLAWVRVMDSVPEGLELVEHPLEWDPKLLVQNLVHRVSLGAYERVRWTYRLRCTRRGLFRLGPASLRTGDIFGFFPRQRALTEQDFILVYPRTVPLPDTGLPARWPVGDRRGARRLYQDPARPSGVRDYLPGDPVKHIDWKATARRGGLQVKVFEPGASILAVPVVNVDTIGVPYGGAIPHHLERVLTTAASLTEEALGHGLNVGLITNGKSALYDHPMSVAPGRSRQQLDMIYEALAMVTPYVGSPIEEQLLMAARRLPPGVTLVLVTAILTTELRQSLQLLLHEKRVPMVLWVADFEPERMPVGVPWWDLAPYLASLEEEHGDAS